MPPQAFDDAVFDELLTTRQSKWSLTVVLHLRRDTKRFTELQRPCHEKHETIETVFQRSGFTEAPTKCPRDMTSGR